ncbi:50S ribosome-binding GTPase [Microbacterium sp. cf046]|uniref:dynamin family protein n=1 Tax=Microbacterium sp. cf046 TaxID=1761803 RepID=UPI0008F0B5D6|nr:dynamin family protein [Microbacterium sp. cf046]SFR94744.1 50S ribosome-binding GTPase [Microbacterium sp. cf046]
MNSPTKEDAEVLLQTAGVVYDDDPAALTVIAELERRLHEPLRLAIAGMVKAGKSTLLNAMLGEQIAPTDAGECTRLVTWYRYSKTPTITLHTHAGEPRRMPVRREHGRLVMGLGGVPAEDVDWIDVGWPLEGLKSMILIDTPGIASLSEDTSKRTTRFLTPEESPSSADAVVYLMRHLHASDVKFLEAFRDTAAGAAQTVCAVGVLSRSDEIGSGRIDSLLSAGKVARRYEHDGDLASLVLGVIPVAGLVAEGARTLREKEYAAFRELAALERADRERLFISADRFTGESDATTLSAAERRSLLSRFGIFGVRLATALIRGGASTSSELSDAMVKQSGLVELRQFVNDQFRTRATTLKLRGVLLELEKLIRDNPREGTEQIRAGIERISAAAHTLRELALLASARSDGLPFSQEDAADAQRIIGGSGTFAHVRLGLPDDSDDETMRACVDAKLAYWRTLAESPLTERAAVGVCRVVIRSLDEVASEVAPAPEPVADASEVAGADDPLVSSADVVLTSGPGDGLGQSAEEQGEDHKSRLRRKKKEKRLATFAERHPLR